MFKGISAANSAFFPDWAEALLIVGAVIVAVSLISLFFWLVKMDKKVENLKSEPKQTTGKREKPEKPQKKKPDPVIQPVVQAKPAVKKPQPVKTVTIVRDVDEDDKEDNDKPLVILDDNVRYIVIKYNKSFTAKLIQSSEEVKNYYSSIKNELLSYKGIKSRMSWKYETFSSGRTTYARLSIRGKNLCVFYAIDPKSFNEKRYILDDMSDVAAYEKTPSMYRIKNDRRAVYAKELIEKAMDGREKNEGYAAVDWAAKFPYEETDPLIGRGLVKVLTDEEASSGEVFKPKNAVRASEVDSLMGDEIAGALIEEIDEISDKTKACIVNIDTLRRYFNDGEKVTLNEIKNRIPEIAKRATCLKVLARGTLDKKLTVVADSFSLQAAKMILLTGGSVIKKRGE